MLACFACDCFLLWLLVLLALQELLCLLGFTITLVIFFVYGFNGVRFRLFFVGVLVYSLGV